MRILTKATRKAHEAKLAQVANSQRYSQFPVHETEFWENVFKYAKDSRTAQKVLNELALIEDEPCIENDRVWRNVRTAKSLAKLALLS
jgi:hypothetical protein